MASEQMIWVAVHDECVAKVAGNFSFLGEPIDRSQWLLIVLRWLLVLGLCARSWNVCDLLKESLGLVKGSSWWWIYIWPSNGAWLDECIVAASNLIFQF